MQKEQSPVIGECDQKQPFLSSAPLWTQSVIPTAEASKCSSWKRGKRGGVEKLERTIAKMPGARGIKIMMPRDDEEKTGELLSRIVSFLSQPKLKCVEARIVSCQSD